MDNELERIEDIIISNLIYNEEYTRTVLPFIDSEYFKENRLEQILINEIGSFFNKYNKPITKQILQIEISNRKDINDKELELLVSKINQYEYKDINKDWLIAESEKFCKDKSVYNAIIRSIKIIEGKDNEFKEDAIPTILSDALAVSFNSDIGHDYLLDAEARFEHYHNVEEKLPFDIELLNKITGGGLPRKTLTCFIAGCVHPDTLVTLKINDKEFLTEIKNVEHYINQNQVEVYSPDGFIPVVDFIHKGYFEEYIVKTENGLSVRCNADHLFETLYGWESAADLLTKGISYFHTVDGLKIGTIEKTGNLIPIVDITVEHENKRYYTNGISSHNTGVGKSLTMCHFAASALSNGKNVLYITMEMSEEKIAERIDANLLNIPIHELKTVEKTLYDTRIKRVMDKTIGKLYIKEYPTSSAHVGHFRALLEELKMKKGFKPDLIVIDYMNICASQRMKFGGSVNSYTYIKAISEEVRALAVQYNVPIITATQPNREGQTSSDMEMTNVSESMGSVHTFDLFLSLMSSEELENMGQIMVKQLKNRFNDLNYYKRFTIGIDKSKMKLFDVEGQAATNLADTGKFEQTPQFGVNALNKTKQIETSTFKF